MNIRITDKTAPRLMLALGALGFALRRLLYTLALDEKNLLLRGHPLEWLLWAVAAGALAVAVLNAWKPVPEEPAASRQLPGGADVPGCLLLAAGTGITVLLDGFPQGGLELARCLLGLASAAALAAAAWCRKKGKEHFLLYAVVCVSFAVRMVSCYRLWSSNPQLQDYVFTLFACIALMLRFYQQAARLADCANLRLLRFAGLAAVFCCFVCLSGTEDPLLYLTGGIWALTDLTAPVCSQPEE